MSNIVIFPKAKRDGSPVQNYDELIEKVNEARIEHIEYLVDEIMSFIFQRVGDEGFDLLHDESSKSLYLFIESFRSVLLGSCDIPHPLQVVAEQMLVIEKDSKDEGNIEEDIVPPVTV